MKAEIIAVGTEILLGHIVNTNAVYLSKKLARLGIDLYYRTTVGDNPVRLAGVLKEALLRSDIVFTMGGLGPTVDDITLSSICSATSGELIFDKKIKNLVMRHFRKRGLKKTPKDALRQAYVPHGARWFENKVGTAPGILIERGKKILVALPGPPRELIPIFENNVVPYLEKMGIAGNGTIKTRRIKIVGLVEAEVNRIVKDLLVIGPGTTLGIYVHLGEVELKITSKAKNEKTAADEIKKVEGKIRKRLGNHIYGTDNESLEFVVGKMLAGKRKTIAVAESATGGLIANRITNISGSSRYFKTGIIAYSNKTKTDLLKVPANEIEKYGAVSKEVALLMAKGLKKLSQTDVAIGVTGIAGPTGATEGSPEQSRGATEGSSEHHNRKYRPQGASKKKPVGLIYIAAVTGSLKMIKECHFTGNREEIKLQASTAALDLARAACARS